MGGFNSVVNQFAAAGTRYAAAVQPYAIKLFFALLLLDILVTYIQFVAEGQLEGSRFLGGLIKHVLSGGFVYLMIVNAFSWMTAVMQSFSRIGSSLTGLPALSPQTVLTVGGNMAETIFDTPASTGLMNNLELAIVQSVAAFFVLLAFVVAAAILTLALVEAYLVIGSGVILLGFGANRFTAPAADGYFAHVLRLGVRILFLYLVLGVGMQLATEWNATLTAACNPAPVTLPWWSTYGLPPSAIMTTACSNVIPGRMMLDLVALSALFVIVTVAVPTTAANLVTGTVGLALSHAFEAAYIAQTIVRPVTSAMHSGFGRVADAVRGKEPREEPASWLRAMELSQHARRTAPLASDAAPRVPAPANPRATSLVTPNSRDTTALNPSTRPISQSNGTKAVGRPTSTV